MKLPRERVSIAEVLATDSEALDKILEFHDFTAGEYFFIKDQPDREWIIESGDVNDFLCVIYDTGKSINFYDHCLPLIGASGLIDLLNYYGESFELRTWDAGWFIINAKGIIYSTEGDDLVGFLWRALVQTVTK